jgi:hypothetical protein
MTEMPRRFLQIGDDCSSPPFVLPVIYNYYHSSIQQCIISAVDIALFHNLIIQVVCVILHEQYHDLSDVKKTTTLTEMALQHVAG